MSPEKRRRLVLLGLAVLLHCIVFFALCRLIIFPAPAVAQSDSEFHQFRIPARAIPPPAAPSAMAQPNFTPISPAQPVTVVTTTPSNFTMPKIEVPRPTMPNLPPPMTTTEPSNLANANANTAATGAGTGNGNGVDGATDSFATLAASLKGDPRGGEIVGMCVAANQPYSNAAAIDDIVTAELPIIGWNINDPRVDQDRPGIRHGKDVPPWSPHPEWFENNANTIGDIIGANIALNRELRAVPIKTIVLVANFKNPDLNRFGDPNDQPARIHNLNTATEDNELTLLISTLRARGIRLCVISFENPPFPELQKYVTESGGIVLYPRGVPIDKIETQLKNTATSK